MSGEGPSRWMDQIVSWCLGILFAAIALYCAVKLIEAILPALIVTIGMLAILGLVVGGIVVFRACRNRW